LMSPAPAAATMPTSDGFAVGPSNFFALDFKGKIARFKFCVASTTIANDRSIFRVVDRGAHSAPG
jgi:hypothetical protein